MGSLFDGLKSLNVADARIHYEFFGPGATLHKERPSGFESLVEQLGDRAVVPVQFARSGIEATRDLTKGSLLDLAESEGLQPAYGCRSGICQTCATKVVQGEVDYVKPPMVAPGEDTALICCNYPRAKTKDGDVTRLVLDL